MGKIKGWKKTRDNKKFESWVNNTTNKYNKDVYVEIEKIPKNKQYVGSLYIVIFNNPNRNYKEGRTEYNYKSAKKLALELMKKYPRG